MKKANFGTKHFKGDKMDFTLDCYPSCVHYSKLLDWAQNWLGITHEQARRKFGLYTYIDWGKLIKNREIK